MSTILEIKYPKGYGSLAGKIRRRLIVEPLKIIGDINNVPVDKTYNCNAHQYIEGKIVDVGCYLKLNIEENDYVTQRCHLLYKSSKNGYYCVVCQNKCYFDTDEIESLKEKQ